MPAPTLPDDLPVVLFGIADIIVPEDRQRQNAKADPTLVASIETRGLMNPILLHGDGTLIAGERRLDAHRQLNRSHIRAFILESLPPLVATRLELAENLARKALTWQEETAAVAKYHGLRAAGFPGWTAKGTATDLGLSESTISRYLAVASSLDDEEVRACPTFTGAFNLITARAQRASIAAHSRGLEVSSALALALPPAIPEGATKEERTRILLASVDLNAAAAETVEDLDKNLIAIEQGRIAAAALEVQRRTEVVSDLVINADFLEWVSSYTGPRFDVLHVDFPYGIKYSGARTRRTGPAHIAPVYLDDPDVFFALLEGILEHQDRIAFPAAHCLFWFDMRHYAPIVDAFTSAGWKTVTPWPYIWTKGYQGIASDPSRRPRHCYEACLIFVRGDRKLVRLDKDHFEATLDEKLHLNQKPLPMLKHLLSMFVDEHTAMLDPTCGSGAALGAAAQLRAARFLGIELDSSNAEVARFLLQRHAPAETNNG